MTVHLYTLCLNEADILGFFFRHYDPWVDRYVVYDDGSEDESLDILEAHPRVELREMPGGERRESFVLIQRILQNEVWKESRGEADWVVITALDEHLWCPLAPMDALIERLAAQGVTAVPALGYQMLSEDFPRTDELLCTTRTIGAPWGHMSKLSLFRPDALEETRFVPGRHSAAPTGDVVYPERDELLLLHYRYLGFERLLRRNALYRRRLGDQDRELELGFQYSWDRSRVRADWDGFAARAVDVTTLGPDPGAADSEPRWWREVPPAR